MQAAATDGGHRRTTLRVCGANTCCIRGADDAFQNLEDLIPPGDVQIGRTACFAQCGIGPNVSVTCGHNAARTHHGVDTVDATCRLLRRAAGVRVPRVLAHASRLREEAQQAAADKDHVTSGTKARMAVQALSAQSVLRGSVAALRLLHKLLLMQAVAARERSSSQPNAGAGAAAAEEWLECAHEAREVQMRLCRAHGAGPHAQRDQSGPRLVPALLLEAQAHLHLAATVAATAREAGAAADDHRRRARELLAALKQPPYEPAQSRAHRARLAEKRAAAELLGDAG